MVSVLQASAWYPPNHLGGTEVYLSSLVRELRALGISSRVIAPLGLGETIEYEFDGTKVRTFSANPFPSRSELRGETPDAGIQRFRQLLAEERADIYHQHSWTRGLGAAHLHAAREAGFKTVLTIHTPAYICLRGTMVRFGKEACDGWIDPKVCSACWCQAQGAPKVVARALSAVSPRTSAALGRLPFGRASTALSARWLGEYRKQAFVRTISDADRIVAVCRWLFDALARNGVPTNKLVLSRQGVDPAFADEATRAALRRTEYSNQPFHLLYVGRWHPIKGIDVLVRAVRAVPLDVPVVLSIHGAGEGSEELAYRSYIHNLAEGDGRIAIRPPIAREDLASTLARASALAVPSLWLESGPLVVLEAQAANIPIIGSRLGGIAELVREPEGGILVSPGNVKEWTNAIARMTATHRKLANAPAPEIRTMRDVANEMSALYDSLTDSDSMLLGV